MKSVVLLTLLWIAVAGQGFAQLTVTPITWDVVGLDHNRPLTSGPELFPVGAEVCSASATTDVTVDFVWPDGEGASHDYINNRPGSLTSLTFDSIGAGECVDAYFELKITRDVDAFEKFREYVIEATDSSGTVATPSPRQIYIERLVSQNRNTTDKIRYGQQADQSDWVELGAGGSINLAVGETYFIELTTKTSTAYEELQSFLTLSNTIFQVISVSTTYDDRTAPLSRVPNPNPRLWADGCLWESDVDSPNYLSCLEDGKAGGTVVTTYEIRIISSGGDSVGLEALIYDRSGSSFHYNTDYTESPGDLVTVDPTTAGFSKRFIPSSIGADGTATLRLTISNPNPLPGSGYRFDDSLPGDMVVAATPNVSNGCGGTVTAGAGATTISLSGGSLAANSSCSILVDVTVPYDAGATYPLTLDNSVDLYVGSATDPSATAEASLEVTEEPPPPLDCRDYAAGTSIADWNSFADANDPNHPPTGPAVGGLGVGTSAGAANSTDVASSRWVGAVAGDASEPDKLGNARAIGQYFEFVVDTEGLDQVSLSFIASRQNGNGPSTVTLDYGPAESFTLNAQTWTAVSTNANSPSTLTVSNLTNLNPTGNTLFRFYIYDAANPNIDFRIHQMNFTGSGTVCTPVDPDTAPDPPTISKAFDPTSVRIGATSTLTFTLSNTNAADDLTGVTFRDELPSGMTAVSGTFVNNCGTSAWGPESGDLTILSFTGGQLAANGSCTLSVDVVSTTVGSNVNLSDPVDSVETLPGNTAVATLEILPPPAPPILFKQFSPNPLLDPDGSTTLTFRVTNADPTLAISSVAFVDPLPTGMQPASPSNITDNGACGGSYSLTWNAGAGELTFADGAIAAETVCVVTIDVEVPGVDVSAGPVEFANQTGLVRHVYNGITYEGNDAEATLVVDNPIPGISFLKQVGLTDEADGAWSDYLAVEVGNQAYYKLTVENTGETVLTNIGVTDALVDTSGCSWPASLPVADKDNPLGSEAHIAVCIVGPVDILVAGTVPNTAVASGESGDDDVSDTDSATRATALLELVKAASPTTFTAAGEVISYTFTVTNDGAAILPGPATITDALIPGATCPSLTTIGNNDNFFDPAESIVCTGSYTTTGVDVANGSRVNTAYATLGGIDSPNDSATVSLPAPPTPTPTNTPVPPTPTPTDTPVPPTPTPTDTPVPPTPTPTDTPVPPTPTPTDTPVPPTPTPTDTPVPPTPTPTDTPVPPTPTPTDTPVPPTPTPTDTPVPPTPTPTDTPVPPTPTPTDTPVPPTPTPTDTPVPPTPTPTDTPVPPTPTPTDTPVPPTPTPTGTPTTPTPTTTPASPTPTPTSTPVPPPTVILSASKVSLPGDGIPVAAGDTISYSVILAVSFGPTTADVVLADNLGSGLTFGSITNNPGGFVAGGTGNSRTFTLPGGAAAGTYMVEYTATVDQNAAGSTINNDLRITGDGGDPDPECAPCSTGHPLEGELESIPTLSPWGLLIMILLLSGAAVIRMRSG